MMVVQERALFPSIGGTCLIDSFIISINRLTATRKVLQRYLSRYENEGTSTPHFSSEFGVHVDLLYSRHPTSVDNSNAAAFTMPLIRNTSDHLVLNDPVIHLSLRSAPSPLANDPHKVKHMGSPFGQSPKISHLREECESGLEDMEDVDVNVIREIQRQQLMKKEEQSEQTASNRPLPAQMVSLDPSVSPLTSESNPFAVEGVVAENPVVSTPPDLLVSSEVTPPMPLETPPADLQSGNSPFGETKPVDYLLDETNPTNVQSPETQLTETTTNTHPNDSPSVSTQLTGTQPADSLQDVQPIQIRGVSARRRRKPHVPAIARSENSISNSFSSLPPLPCFTAPSISTVPTRSSHGLTAPGVVLSKPFPLDTQIDKTNQIPRYSIERINSL